MEWRPGTKQERGERAAGFGVTLPCRFAQPIEGVIASSRCPGPHGQRAGSRLRDGIGQQRLKIGDMTLARGVEVLLVEVLEQRMRQRPHGLDITAAGTHMQRVLPFDRRILSSGPSHCDCHLPRFR